MNLKSVMKGERVIDDSTRSDLPRAEDAGLRCASDGLLELERLRQQSLRLVIEYCLSVTKVTIPSLNYQISSFWTRLKG